MIGPTDIMVPPTADAVVTLDVSARIIQRHWNHARFEDPATGKKYRTYDEIPFSHLEELLAYRNAQAEALWDSDSPESPVNTMLHLIFFPKCIKSRTDDQNAPNIQSIRESIRASLRMDILNTYALNRYADAA